MKQNVRIVLGSVGLDFHDAGMKVFARFMRDAGFEVIYLGPRQTVERMVSTALQEDADIIGFSIYSGIYFEVAEETMSLLRKENAGDIKVVMGGIIPTQDVPALLQAGVSQAFVSGEPLINIADMLCAVAASRESNTNKE